MELTVWRRDVDVFSFGVIQETLPVVVGLNVVSPRAGHFPVDLVQVIRQQYHAAYYALTWSTLDDISHMAEKKFEVCKESGRVISFCEGQFCALGTETDRFIIGYGPVTGNGFDCSEVDGVGAGREPKVIRAGT